MNTQDGTQMSAEESPRTVSNSRMMDLPDFSKLQAESERRSKEMDKRILASGLMTEEELREERLRGMDPLYVMTE